MHSLRYSKTAILLHWLMAAFILANLGLGISLDGLPLSKLKIQLINWHKWLGVTILLLAAIRIFWRLRHEPPAFTGSVTPLEKTVAKWVHRLLYALFFVIPLTGWAMSSAKGYPVVYLGLLPLPDLIGRQTQEVAEQLEQVHAWTAYLLAVLVGLHIAGALKHHFQEPQGFLYRMGIGSGRTKEKQ